MRSLSFIVALLTIWACKGPKPLDEMQLRAFVKDTEHGLRQEKMDGDFRVEVEYRPTDFIVLQQVEGNTMREQDSLRKAYASYLYFRLTIEKQGKDLETYFAVNPATFEERVSYLNSAFTKKISLSHPSGDQAIEDYVYMRSFGSGPSTFLVVFKKVDENFDLIVEGTDLGFGKLKFPFRQNDIDNIPPLKL